MAQANSVIQITELPVSGGTSENTVNSSTVLYIISLRRSIKLLTYIIRGAVDKRKGRLRHQN
jgi:hypothetical protein